MLQRGFLEDAMQRALTLARRGPADDENPQVGCVVLDPEGRIVAEGWHLGAGTPHAEVDALSRVPSPWRDRAGELTAVVTLEPCNHTGRTGPCAQALRAFGVGAVVYAAADSGELSGGGAETLRAAGVEVVGGVLEKQAAQMLGPWLARRDEAVRRAHPHSSPSSVLTPLAAMRQHRPRPRRPRTIAKWAQSLDGRGAAANGTSQWITGSEARADVHRRRAEADAILIGTGTLYADDPSLTARDARGELLVPAEQQPIPVIVGRRPIPPGAKVLQHPALAANDLDAPLRLEGVDLETELSTLARYRIYSVFVEGGPRVINSLLKADLVDELLVYIAPALLGGPKVSVGNIGVSDISEIRRLRVDETLPLGPDLLLRGRWSERSSNTERLADSFVLPTTEQENR